MAMMAVPSLCSHPSWARRRQSWRLRRRKRERRNHAEAPSL